jgi:Uma2 family endonuclease
MGAEGGAGWVPAPPSVFSSSSSRVSRSARGSFSRMENGHLVAVAPSWQRRLTIREYHRMVEAHVFEKDARLELLEGVLVAMSPQSDEHVRPIVRLNRILVRSLGDDYEVRPQVPLTLENDSEPEPDLAVVRASDRQLGKHPGYAELVIEVAYDSLDKDRGAKAAIYARAGIPEYWIVDVVDVSVEVLREPDAAAATYRSSRCYRRGESVAVGSLSGLAVRVDDVF